LLSLSLLMLLVLRDLPNDGIESADLGSITIRNAEIFAGRSVEYETIQSRSSGHWRRGSTRVITRVSASGCVLFGVLRC
jgi:hypothetical protein